MSGTWIKGHDPAVRQLLAVPYFEVGTHGNVHVHLSLHEADSQAREISGPVTMLKATYGHQATLFRPPYGEFNDATVALVKSLGLELILWTIKSGDPDPSLSAEMILTRLKRQLRPGSIIVLHANGKGRHTRERIEQRGATLLFLPPYSPDLNPIENDFATIKINREYHENETLDTIVSMYK